MLSIDFAILYFFNVTLSSPWLDSVMIYITDLPHWFPIYFFFACYLIAKYKWRGVRIVVACALVVGLADLLTYRILKELIARPRPCSLVNDPSGMYSWIHLPYGARAGFSFPSSHAVNNFTGTIFLFLLLRKDKILLWLFVPAIIIPLSRVYLGLHYPSDIIAGAIIGSAFGWGCAKIYQLIERKFAL
jgi:undecaprenyl-diphosphatase